MPVKDFDASRRSRRPQDDPVGFKLRGHEFHCADTLPWTAYERTLEIAEMAPDVKHAGRVTKATHPVARMSMKVGPFLRACVVDDDQELLEAVLASRVDPVDLEELTDIVNWLLGVYTGKVAEQLDESSGGSSTTSHTTKRVSLTEGTVTELHPEIPSFT